MNWFFQAFDGRINRPHYWIASVIGYIAFFLVGIIFLVVIFPYRAELLQLKSPAWTALGIAALVAALIGAVIGLFLWGVEWRRLHDVGMTGWVSLIPFFVSLIPFIGIVTLAYLVVLGCLPPKDIDNDCGEPDTYTNWWTALIGQKPKVVAKA